MKLALTFAALCLSAGVVRADTAADVDKFLAWFDNFTDLAVSDQSNCPRMGKDLNKSLDDNKALLDAVERAMVNGDDIPADAAQHMADTQKRLSAVVKAKCSTEPGVEHAMRRLPGRNRK